MSTVQARQRPTREQVERRQRTERALAEVKAHNRGVTSATDQRMLDMGADCVRYSGKQILRERSGQASRHRPDEVVKAWAKAVGVAEELELDR